MRVPHTDSLMAHADEEKTLTLAPAAVNILAVRQSGTTIQGTSAGARVKIWTINPIPPLYLAKVSPRHSMKAGSKQNWRTDRMPSGAA